jgi:fumarylpyruvate hydrolase
VGHRKSFAEAAPIGVLHPAPPIGHPQRGAIWLDVNGKRRQQGDLADMIWDVAHTVHFLSQYYELLPGDLIFTGTPAGSAPSCRETVSTAASTASERFRCRSNRESRECRRE